MCVGAWLTSFRDTKGGNVHCETKSVQYCAEMQCFRQIRSRYGEEARAPARASRARPVLLGLHRHQLEDLQREATLAFGKERVVGGQCLGAVEVVCLHDGVP